MGDTMDLRNGTDPLHVSQPTQARPRAVRAARRGWGAFIGDEGVRYAIRAQLRGVRGRGHLQALARQDRHRV
ncbi:hypothetical protein BN13_1400002 [Nostocoides jenkinsii Ben 74]|uniref:Uncharacterized protein n=1 Tax=Nostocoides jenkinsii Ben 74 TaxID=1193518 RepID=A0A077MB56_9MICO|nr:hypothetical protein BN13_1400002 [Tetrasphaera jenkinsii Ben 74]